MPSADDGERCLRRPEHLNPFRAWCLADDLASVGFSHLFLARGYNECCQSAEWGQGG